jgi:hypothetical protein
MAAMDKYAGKPLEKPKFDDEIPGLCEDTSKRPVVLYNLAHVARSPEPSDPTNPALRILGVFESVEEATAAAGEMSRKSEPLDYWITPVGQWLMMYVDRNSDAAGIQARIELRLEKHGKRRDRDFEQLKVARDKKLQSRTSYQKKEREARMKDADVLCQNGVSDDNSTKKNNVKELAQKFMRMNQRYAVISVLRDTEQAVRLGKKLPEPLLRIYATFPSKKNATDYIRETLSPHVGEYDLDVVDMYQWLFPQHVESEDLVEEFRDPEINNIMQHAKLEKKTTREFRKRCAETGKQADMAYIVGDEKGLDTVTIEDRSVATRLGALEEAGCSEPGVSFIEEESYSDFDRLRQEFREDLRTGLSPPSSDAGAVPPQTSGLSPPSSDAGAVPPQTSGLSPPSSDAGAVPPQTSPE